MPLDPEEFGRIVAAEIVKTLSPVIDRMIAIEKRYGVSEDYMASPGTEAITKAAKSRKVLTPAERAAVFGLRFP